MDLMELMDALVIKVNSLDSAAHARRSVFADPDSLYDKTVEAYATLAKGIDRLKVMRATKAVVVIHGDFTVFGNTL